MRLISGIPAWILSFSLGACTHIPFNPPPQTTGDFPLKIDTLLSKGCAITGCHDPVSKDAAAGLDMSTWASLFDGSRNNAVVIPYAPQQSPLLFIVNRDTSIAPTLTPTMPPAGPYLRNDEVELINQWIATGAPNDRGEVAFETVDQRDWLYVLNSLCRKVCLIDLNSGLIARYVNLPEDESLGFATEIVVNYDENRWCVLFTNGAILCHDMETHRRTDRIELPKGTWRTLNSGSRAGELIAVNWAGNTAFEGGQIARVNLMDHTVDVYDLPGDTFFFPIAWSGDDSVGYFSAAYLGNVIYHLKYAQSGFEVVRRISLDGMSFNPQQGVLRPSSLAIGPDAKFLYVGCERTGEVIQINIGTGELEEVIGVGYFPQQLLVDKERRLLYVSCTEDVDTYPGRKGAVYAIDLQTNLVRHTWYAGYQSRALYLDRQRSYLYVANRNVDPEGADEPHHYTGCEGRNGYISRINLQTMQVDEAYKAEVSVDPYDIGGY